MAQEKIIVIDDEIDVLELCQRILSLDGYQVKVAHNGYEAIELAQKEAFDLLLTDIKMPGMNGLEIAQALKKFDPSLICVTMTGFSTMDMVIDALKLGIDEFITKPFSPKELGLVISKALEKDRLRKENFRLHSLIPLFELNKTLMEAAEIDTVLHRLLEIAKKETHADFAVLYAFQESKIPLPFYFLPNNKEEREYKETCERLAQLALQEGKQLTLTLSRPENELHRSLLEALNGQTLIVTPLKSQDTNLGVLIVTRDNHDFAPSDGDFLTVLSSQAGIALENARLFTEIQEAYQELQTLDHMKSEFINIAAHELRTPLAILMGYTTVLQEEIEEGILKEYVTNITRNALRLRALIDQMLNLQYLESGLAPLARDKLNLPEAVHNIMEDMSLMVQEKNLEITIDIPADFPQMIVDHQKFDLILMNLLHNAVKFTPKDGQVTFRAEISGDQAVMAVSDTGVGIPKDKCDRIFERFYQVAPSLTREHGGIGLGLTIARAMIEVCGGQIQVESEEGEGTIFTFTLPLDNTNLEKRPLKL